MPDYTIRVELEGSPTREEYDRLHQSMKNLGFMQTVGGLSNGKQVVVQLPTGLYYGASSLDTPTVAKNVDASAKEIRRVIGVFVAKTETWSSRP